jgi:cytochrome d ubiquinol oxidase subunit I
MLSLLSYHDPNARVVGLDAAPPSQRPPINVVRVSFQTMVGIGTFLAALGALVLYLRIRRRRLPESRWFFLAVAAAGPLSYVALVSGWVTTEVGRQPWVVYRVMPTSQAVTAAGGVPVGYAGLWILYLCVGAGVVWILRRLARAPLDVPVSTAVQKEV